MTTTHTLPGHSRTIIGIERIRKPASQQPQQQPQQRKRAVPDNVDAPVTAGESTK
jgi:hypothetical protein